MWGDSDNNNKKIYCMYIKLEDALYKSQVSHKKNEFGFWTYKSTQ